MEEGLIVATSDRARRAYDTAVDDLKKFVEDNIQGLTVVILDQSYPIRVQFFPDPQTNMFGDENVDENGEVNDLTVTVGLSTSVKSTLKFKMAAKLLKKLIKLAEKVGTIYYHAFREEADEEEKTDE